MWPFRDGTNQDNSVKYFVLTHLFELEIRYDIFRVYIATFGY